MLLLLLRSLVLTSQVIADGNIISHLERRYLFPLPFIDRRVRPESPKSAESTRRFFLKDCLDGLLALEESKGFFTSLQLLSKCVTFSGERFIQIVAKTVLDR